MFAINRLVVFYLLALVLPMPLFAIEKPDYSLVASEGDIEVRQYPALIVARTLVEEGFNRAGNEGFRRLGGYIFGDNVSDQKIAMTAPVSQAPDPEGGYWVTFFMPKEHDLDSLPVPVDPLVELTELPSTTFVVLRYRGGWRESRYREHEQSLLTWLEQQTEWVASGEPVWARYNPPMMPSMFRTNEVMIPVVRATQTSQNM